MFGILVNRARATGARENRSIAIGEPGPAADASMFDESGRWASPPERWVEEADERIDAAALGDRIRSALDDLPDRQRQVVILRDVEGLCSEEVCTLLGISQGNQRVLLHRGRNHLREALASEFGKS
jgi:RNA polymerase sigma-70 factor (ECF subfamily)